MSENGLCSGVLSPSGGDIQSAPTVSCDEFSPLLKTSENTNYVEERNKEGEEEKNLENSDLHRNKDFQLIEVPRGRVRWEGREGTWEERRGRGGERKGTFHVCMLWGNDILEQKIIIITVKERKHLVVIHCYSSLLVAHHTTSLCIRCYLYRYS